MKIKVTIKHIGLNDPWEKTLKVSSKAAALEEIAGMITEFNGIEEARYGDKAQPRELVSISEIVKESKPQKVKLQLEFEFTTDKPIGEILCNNCEHNSVCPAEPPCRAYLSLEEFM